MWAAFGIVALYVALQALLRGLIQHAIHATWRLMAGLVVAAREVNVVILTATATINALSAVATIGLSAVLVVLVVRQLWPAAWRCGVVPGFGLALPKSKSCYLSAVLFALATLILGGIVTGLITFMLPEAPNVHQNT